MSDTLTEGQKLSTGESLTSTNGAYTLTLQDDGNLVLAARGQAVWATGTDGQDVVRAEVQTDGNFVVYTADKPVWHTDTKGKKNVRLVLQDDRNLVLYAADGPAWSSKTETDEAPPPPRLSQPRPPSRPPRSRRRQSRNPLRRPSRNLRRRPRRRPLPRRRGPTPWSPVTHCGPSRNVSTATAASISESRTPAGSPTLT